jgi:outer membrane protein assembly factor BamB
VTGTVLWNISSGGDDSPPSTPPRLEELWSRPLAEGRRMTVRSDEMIYLQDEERHEITALDITDGRKRWGHEVPVADIRQDSAYLRDTVGDDIRITGLAGGLLYYGSGDHLFALDADSGAYRWKYMDDSFHASPVVVGDAAYAHMTSFFYVLDTKTGKKLWDYGYDVNADGDITVTGDTLFVHSGRTLIAVDTRTRKQKWTHQAASEAETDPVVADGRVYFGTQDGALYAVDAESGDEVWRRTFEGELWDGRLGGGAGAPDVVGGTVYFENDGYVSAFDADTGRTLWQRKQKADEVEALTVADGAVHVYDSEGDLSSLDARSGKPRWKESLTADPEADYGIVGNTVIVERDGRLTAYRVAT